ncbi:MAG TPA: hypothetical protein DDY39_13235 [Nitrospira sp.]|nr:hypothetical protein [Nitrospira sp.]HBR52193.1 hypothetical protein [Nitrospira sp.]
MNLNSKNSNVQCTVCQTFELIKLHYDRVPHRMTNE